MFLFIMLFNEIKIAICTNNNNLCFVICEYQHVDVWLSKIHALSYNFCFLLQGMVF